MKIIGIIFFLCSVLKAESVRIAWDPPEGLAPTSYAVFVYPDLKTCPTGKWFPVDPEDTKSSALTYVIDRVPGLYYIEIGYYLQGVLQEGRSETITYNLEPGEIAAPPEGTPVPTVTNFRFE